MKDLFSGTLADLEVPSVNKPTFALDHYPLQWQMARAEKFAIWSMLEAIRPAVAIEIGTFKGGSLQILAEHCTKVYSLDISAGPRERLQASFSNVDFFVGNSKDLVPSVLRQISVRQEQLEFVLIDGDHSREGVCADINSVLQFQPQCPLLIAVHDSFHPACRQGIVEADWKSSPFVHFVELDFISGCLFSNQFDTAPPGSMYGGLALALMLPKVRPGDVAIHQSQGGLFDAAYARSCYASTETRSLRSAVMKRMKKLFFKPRSTS